jgi:ATPase subunit of ABC transporter with duplicated ATPase domains
VGEDGELDRGEGIPWKGNYSSWLEQKDRRLAQEQKTDDRRMKSLERELEWVRMGAKGRHAKAKARVSNYEAMLKEPTPEKLKDLQIYIPAGPRLGEIVIEAKGVRKGYGDKLLIDNMDLSIPRGAIVGVVGPNGAGKSTLFRMITGKETPDAGTFKVGDTVKIAHIDQNRDQLQLDRTVHDEISDGKDVVVLGGREVPSRAYVSWFNFSGGDQQKKVGMLSGGEKNRLYLAKMLKEGGNLLLLDEPTNDLDVNTMRALEDALNEFGGSAIIISHDRWFLDRVCTHTLAFEGESQVYWYPGPYSEYEQDLKRRLGTDILVPKRIHYKLLAH